MTPTFILVTPQLPENIGMSARGMMNCGLTNLRLVAPRDGWPHERGIAAGSGAFDLMSAPEIYSDTAAAIADLNYIYATSGKLRHMVKPILTGAAAAVDKAGHATDALLSAAPPRSTVDATVVREVIAARAALIAVSSERRDVWTRVDHGQRENAASARLVAAEAALDAALAGCA